MISNQTIKKLAVLSIDQKGEIDEKAVKYVFDKLSKKELKIYLRKIKKIHNEMNVTVRFDGTLTKEIKQEINYMYKNKNINYEKDSSTGGGIMVIDNDMIVNYTVGGIIENKMKDIK